MRIIQLADYGGTYAGSFIPMLRALTRVARARGFDVETIFTPVGRGREWVSELQAEEIPVRFSPTTGRRELRSWLESVVAEEKRPTVLHTHFTAFDVPAAQVAATAPETAAFWHVHSRARPELSVRARNVAKHLLFGRDVSGILCVAPDIATAMRRRFAPRRRVTFLPNAIDVERFPPVNPARRTAARKELRLPSDRRVLLHFGWDWQRKGGDLLLRAMSALVLSDPALIVASVGAGAEAQDLAARLGLERHFRALEPTDRVQALYAAADVFVSSSRAEGMPFSVAEALICGVPVVASDIPGHAQIGTGLDACRLTRLEPGALATGITEILSRSSADAHEQACLARAQIRATMDLRPWAERVLRIYEQAM